MIRQNSTAVFYINTVGCAEVRSASFAIDALRTSAHPTYFDPNGDGIDFITRCTK